MLSPKIENIAVSGTMEIAAKIIEMKSSCIEVYDLCAGESDFPTPDHIKAAAQNAIADNKTRYTINSGIIELRKAICDKFLRDYAAHYQPHEVIVSNGAKQAVYNALQTITSEGDEVILSKPYYVSYPHMIKLTGATPKIVTTKTENAYKLTGKELLENINEKTKAVVICNPNNPSGSVYTEKEIKDIIEIAYEKNIWVVADEIYEKFIYDSIVFTSFASLDKKYKNNLIIVNGVSKAYAMTGWRIGYAVSTSEVIMGMNKLQSHSTSNACTISQHAALAALTGTQMFVEEQRKIFEERRNIIHNALTNIDKVKFIEPNGAFYFFVNIEELLKHTTIKNSQEFCMKLLNEGHVGTVPGSVFGMDGYIRIAYTKSKEELMGAMKRLSDTIKIFIQAV
jgi:aspartate aminotransferase